MTLRLIPVLAMWALPLLAGEPELPVQEQVKQLVAQLSSEDFNVRVHSIELARRLPAEALPLIDAALAAAKGKQDLLQGLTKARAIVAVSSRRRAREDKDRAFLEWNNKTMVEAYKQHGSKNPNWDAMAIEALERMAVVWTNFNTATVQDKQAVFGLAQTAIGGPGCNDALVYYVRARSFESMPRADRKISLDQHLEAARKMFTSGYHPARKAFASFRAADLLAHSEKKLSAATREQALKLFEQGMEQMAEGLKDKELPPTVIRDFWTVALSAHIKLDPDRKTVIERASGVLSKALPDSPLPLVLKAAGYTDYAWDARGQGLANTVTEQGRKLMHERLLVAEALLERAWKLDPKSPDAAVQMITVELGQGKGRARMEMWFKRAMEADPDCIRACENKLYYLEPKWFGSNAAMLELGRECLKTGNWEARLPCMLVDAHFKASNYEKDYTHYFRNPAVWPDLKVVYDGLLKHNPDDKFDRSWYARCAALCGKYDIAAEQFKILGDAVQLRAFKNEDELELLRRTSEGAVRK